ncbi:hypothetical protein HYT58_00310 [Candidatus Woesearchaeota archaeon]|nr:hypothetical protein [Candidatus Woesearchaeota archaeon]
MKGQSETIGLMIIVILLILIGLVFLRFSMNKDNVLPELRTNIQTSNLLTAILRYNVGNDDVRGLIVKCVQQNECSVLNKEVKAILDNTVDKRAKYEFKAVYEEKEVIRIGGCNRGLTSNIPISEAGLFIETRLKICSN